VLFLLIIGLLKDKRRAEAKGNLYEVAQILNAIGEIYSKLGMLKCLYIYFKWNRNLAT